MTGVQHRPECPVPDLPEHLRAPGGGCDCEGDPLLDSPEWKLLCALSAELLDLYRAICRDEMPHSNPNDLVTLSHLVVYGEDLG